MHNGVRRPVLHSCSRPSRVEDEGSDTERDFCMCFSVSWMALWSTCVEALGCQQRLADPHGWSSWASQTHQASIRQAWVAELWTVGSSLHPLSAPTRPKVPPADAWSGIVSRAWSPRSSHPCWTVASPSDSVLTSWGKRKGHGRGRWWLPPSCPHFPGLSPHKLLPS